MLQLGDRKVCKRARRSGRRRDSPGDHIVERVSRERDLTPDTVRRRREQHRRLHDELRVARWDCADGARLAECRRALVEHVPIGDELLELVRSENDITLASLCVVRRHISGALDDRERETGWQPVRQREPRIGRHRRHDHVGPRVDLRGDVRVDDIERAAAGADRATQSFPAHVSMAVSLRSRPRSAAPLSCMVHRHRRRADGTGRPPRLTGPFLDHPVVLPGDTGECELPGSPPTSRPRRPTGRSSDRPARAEDRCPRVPPRAGVPESERGGIRESGS